MSYTTSPKFYNSKELERMRKIVRAMEIGFALLGAAMLYGIFYFYADNITDFYYLTKEVLYRSVDRIAK